MHYEQLKWILSHPHPRVLEGLPVHGNAAEEPPTEPTWQRHIAEHPAAVRTLIQRLPPTQQVVCALIAARMTLSWYEQWTDVAGYAIHAEIGRCVELALTSVPTVEGIKRGPRQALELVEQWLAPGEATPTAALAEAAERAYLAGCAVAYDDYEDPAREVAFACGKLAEAVHAPSRFACADALGSVASAIVRHHRKQLAGQPDTEETEGEERRQRGSGGPPALRADEYAHLSAFFTRWWRHCRERLPFCDALTAEVA